MHALNAIADQPAVPAPCVAILRSHSVKPALLYHDRLFPREVGRLALRSLYAELILYPKPGLVSLVDNGSHDDMTAATFMRSLFSLRHYFAQITKAGMADASFATLKLLGIEAERRMLLATKDINTHRGAIFCLGLLCATIGYAHAQRLPLSPQTIRASMQIKWGEALTLHMRHMEPKYPSHGFLVNTVHAVRGARGEAALGLPSVFEVAFPVMQKTMNAGRGWDMARIDAMFALMAHIGDTNVYYRSGNAGAIIMKHSAQAFIDLGGTAHPEWKTHAIDCHHNFIRQRISPGGAADLLAATCLLYQVTRLSSSWH